MVSSGRKRTIVAKKASTPKKKMASNVVMISTMNTAIMANPSNTSTAGSFLMNGTTPV
mgnify:CR=1 FL=1